MTLITSRSIILALSLSVLVSAPAAWAQPGGGVSVHAKTVPSSRPAPAQAEQKQPAQPVQPQQQPAQKQAQPAQPATPAQPAQAAAPAPSGQQPQQAGNSQKNAAPNIPPNPLGAGGGWNPEFSNAPMKDGKYAGTQEQIATIQKINDYFNAMKNLEGDFLQTEPDGKRKKGKFYLERPGKVRFDYALPSRQKIISDGKYLAIEDHDLRTTDRHAIESTPFRMLLTKTVDLLKDSTVLALDATPDAMIITLEDKKSSMGGQIRLFFTWPEIQLKEWLVTDAQGLTTRIELGNVVLNKPVDPKLFTFSPDLGLPTFKGSSN
ncbi:MAG: outer-membrane lipoprotein carrier protein LolA [Alphaproteobacteria bacterium]